ncbi:Uncharacterised protein [Vibrio cholerae]|nr:Uncharacterised protein [Vibrio cholerae]
MAIRHKNRIDFASAADSSTQRSPISTCDRLFTSSIDIEHDQYINLLKYVGKIIIQIASSRVTMGLENHH